MSDLCDEMEKFGKGIGSPARYAIIEELFKGPRTVGKLVTATGQSQSCVSQHLKTLKLSNLVTDERQGQEVVYTLNAEHLLDILKKLSVEINKNKK